VTSEMLRTIVSGTGIA